MYAGEYTESTSSPAAATVTSSSSSPKFAIDGSKSIHSHRSTHPPPWSWPSRTSHFPQIKASTLRMLLEFFPSHITSNSHSPVTLVAAGDNNGKKNPKPPPSRTIVTGYLLQRHALLCAKMNRMEG
ncbi:unnamed protein product [Linum trigynum]|uniref:Uncharacterized protein n=1 Tax=Linum trigynum TaxID=586398 RepID=A0AAV2DSH8_9ROSI